MTSRSPRGDQPRWRVKLVLTKVSSMKTTQPGLVETAGKR